MVHTPASTDEVAVNVGGRSQRLGVEVGGRRGLVDKGHSQGIWPRNWGKRGRKWRRTWIRAKLWRDGGKEPIGTVELDEENRRLFYQIENALDLERVKRIFDETGDVSSAWTRSGPRR